MPPVTDIRILGQIMAALTNWRFTGYVTAKDLALEWLTNELPGATLKEVAKAMNDHVQAGGVIDQVSESRPEWSAWPFHYDFRLRLAGRD